MENPEQLATDQASVVLARGTSLTPNELVELSENVNADDVKKVSHQLSLNFNLIFPQQIAIRKLNFAF